MIKRLKLISAIFGVSCVVLPIFLLLAFLFIQLVMFVYNIGIDWGRMMLFCGSIVLVRWGCWSLSYLCDLRVINDKRRWSESELEQLEQLRGNDAVRTK